MPNKPIVHISKRFSFDCAHRLMAVPDDHPCGRMHGHTYLLEVEIKGIPDPASGWLMDFAELKKIVQPLVNSLDHRCLNDIEAINFGTAEELVLWFWNRLKPDLPMLSRITVFETPTSRCDYYGEQSD